MERGALGKIKTFLRKFSYDSHSASQVTLNDMSALISVCIICSFLPLPAKQRQTFNNRTALADRIVDHSDLVGPSPVGSGPTTSSFST